MRLLVTTSLQFLVLFTENNHSVVLASENECKDLQSGCIEWQEAGECQRDPQKYFRICPRSCNLCSLMDKTQDFGVRQTVGGRHSYVVSQIFRDSLAYMNSDQVFNLEPQTYLNCVNNHESCSHWAHLGGKNHCF